MARTHFSFLESQQKGLSGHNHPNMQGDPPPWSSDTGRVLGENSSPMGSMEGEHHHEIHYTVYADLSQIFTEVSSESKEKLPPRERGTWPSVSLRLKDSVLGASFPCQQSCIRSCSFKQAAKGPLHQTCERKDSSLWFLVSCSYLGYYTEVLFETTLESCSAQEKARLPTALAPRFCQLTWRFSKKKRSHLYTLNIMKWQQKLAWHFIPHAHGVRLQGSCTCFKNTIQIKYF